MMFQFAMLVYEKEIPQFLGHALVEKTEDMTGHL